MSEEEIQAILVANLTGHSTKDALTLSQRDVGFKILDKFTGEPFNADLLRILRLAVEVQSEFGRIASLQIFKGGEVIEVSVEKINRLLNLYSNFVEAFALLYQNYEGLDLSKPSEHFSKEMLGKFYNAIDTKLKRYKAEFDEGAINFSPEDFDGIYHGVGFLFRTILGKEGWQKFGDEFNHASGVLRKMQDELIPEKPDINKQNLD